MNLTRWDPFRELESLSKGLNQWFGQPVMRRLADEDGVAFADWAPALDVEETDKEYLIKADLPEIKKDDLKIGIDHGMLTLEGERKHEKEEKGKKFHRVERSYGKFMRRLELPVDVDETKVNADFKDGVLNVHLPKSANAKPRTIDVKVV
ncbi:MAG TPA: Hsp20/alpha crystallin family protein [Vicinamibacterales bacterium]|nr:Hsp20/alpha crystallin family protein [Vicinamibacterales bacterium]